MDLTERYLLYNQQKNNLYAQQAQKVELHCILHFLYAEGPEKKNKEIL